MTQGSVLSRTASSAFLKDLEELTRKHKIVIWGCGCCGSPGLIPLQDTETGPNFRYVVDPDEEDPVCLKWTDE